MSYRSLVTILCLSLFVLLGIVPFSIYGQDGYSHWFPVISEYLKGPEAFRGSAVVFNGQNLGGLYGELPFWKIFRLFQPSIETFLNLTHAVFASLFFLLALTFVNGVKGSKSISDALVVFGFALLSPVIVNRIMAGHINLLFGALPLFVFLAFIFNKSLPVLVLGFFSLWCAWSTHAFQLLAYHVFYLPVLIYFFWTQEQEKKKYLLVSIAIFLLSFGVNFVNFRDMLASALSPDSLRPLDLKMTYSYTVSTFSDLIQFLASGRYPDLLGREMGFFHEINYPVGAFAFFLFVVSSQRKFAILVAALFAFFFLFSADIPPANFLSDLPGIRAFRVPQRLFILIGLLIPLWAFASMKLTLTRNHLLTLLALILVAQFAPGFDILAVLVSVALYVVNKTKYAALAVIIAFAGLTTGSLEKIMDSYDTHNIYSQVKEKVAPLVSKYKPDELRSKRFHFETKEPWLVNYVAQSLGIPTLEGYGYPPASLVRKFEEAFQIRMASNQVIFIPAGLPGLEEKSRQYGITTIVQFGPNNELLIKEL